MAAAIHPISTQVGPYLWTIPELLDRGAQTTRLLIVDDQRHISTDNIDARVRLSLRTEERVPMTPNLRVVSGCKLPLTRGQCAIPSSAADLQCIESWAELELAGSCTHTAIALRKTKRSTSAGAATSNALQRGFIFTSQSCVYRTACARVMRWRVLTK